MKKHDRMYYIKMTIKPENEGQSETHATPIMTAIGTSETGAYASTLQ